jgi:hypothetical protein
MFSLKNSLVGNYGTNISGVFHARRLLSLKALSNSLSQESEKKRKNVKVSINSPSNESIEFLSVINQHPAKGVIS